LAAASSSDTMRPVPATAVEPLVRLTEDVRAAAWLVPEHDPLRAYLDMLAELPPTPEAWQEVLVPWLDAARHGRGPALDGRGAVAAAGALGVAALRAARELSDVAGLSASLRAAARWCFFLVRPDAR
jgi:hypothetical protein